MGKLEKVRKSRNRDNQLTIFRNYIDRNVKKDFLYVFRQKNSMPPLLKKTIMNRKQDGGHTGAENWCRSCLNFVNQIT